jgi:hypothetical protein
MVLARIHATPINIHKLYFIVLGTLSNDQPNSPLTNFQTLGNPVVPEPQHNFGNTMTQNCAKGNSWFASNTISGALTFQK